MRSLLIFVFLSICACSLAVNAETTVTYYHNDALGSPIAATDESANILWRETYQPGGTRMSRQAERTNNENRRWFTSHVEDADTGLIYMQGRYYDPKIERFLSPDPVGFTGNPQSVNRYAYANNSPYRYVDPDGRQAFIKFLKETYKKDGNVVEALFEVGGDMYTVVAPCSTSYERLESAVALFSPVDFDDFKLAKDKLMALKKKFGGRKGSLETRAQNIAYSKAAARNGATPEAGFGAKENRIPAANGADKTRYSDGTVRMKDGSTVEFQSVDTKSSGEMTRREAEAASDLALSSNGPVVCVPKW